MRDTTLIMIFTDYVKQNKNNRKKVDNMMDNFAEIWNKYFLE